MPEKKPEQLQERIDELEEELADRERDLALFREELRKANGLLEKFIGQVQQELKLASLIQKVLVPTEFPHIPGFEFSTKFVPSPISGGDYFDVFEHEDKFRFGLVLASSSGYSMSALFLSVLLKMTGQLEARKGASPLQMLEKMAQELVPHIQNQDQAHVFYGVVDRRSYEFSYSSVGGCVALLWTHADNKLQKLSTTTDPFTGGFKRELTSKSVHLNPRDRLILCSEGILRRTNKRGEPFGEDRLFKTVLASTNRPGVHELRNEILYQIEKFGESTDAPKDLTVIVTEVKDRVIKLAK